jgi:hypothetical protein
MTATGGLGYASLSGSQVDAGRAKMIAELRSGISNRADLSADQLYFVIGIEAGDYQILNDAGKPHLYPPD